MSHIDRVVYENEHFRAEQSPTCTVPGYIIVSAKKEAVSLSALDNAAAEALGPTLLRVTKAIEAVVRPERVYCASFGEEWPQVHFHLFPRTKDLAKGYRESHAPGTRLLGPSVVVWACEQFAASRAAETELAKLRETVGAIRKSIQDG